jgi:hypothetical protein
MAVFLQHLGELYGEWLKHKFTLGHDFFTENNDLLVVTSLASSGTTASIDML